MTNVPLNRNLRLPVSCMVRMVDGGVTEDEMMKYLRYKSRDNARTPFQWDDTENAVLRQVSWIMVNPNYNDLCP